MPDWKDLSILFARETDTQITNCLNDPRSDTRAVARGTELRNEIGGLVRQINRMCGSEGSDRIETDRKKLRSLADATIVMDLCEEILKALPDDADTGLTRLFIARKSFAQTFRLGEVEQALERVKLAFAVEPDTDFDPEKIGQTRLQAPVWEEALKQILGGRDPQRVADELYDYLNMRMDPSADFLKVENDRFGPEIDRERDIIAHILDTARISRILTLNYDVQLERSMLRRLDVAGFPEALEFEDLCKDYETPAAHRKVFRIESGVKRGVRSITLGNDNVGDIASFAAYSRRYQYQALHLHGRFDDPDNLVATQADYLSVYMNESPAREVFREVQEILFGGNDVLLLGIGMKEEDVLRPFRRFVARDGRGPHDSRQIFLLRETKRCKNCEIGEDCPKCKTGNDTDSLRHRINYNVLTVVFGGPKFRVAKHRIEAATEALGKVIDKTDEDISLLTLEKEIEVAVEPLSDETMAKALRVGDPSLGNDNLRLLSEEEHETIKRCMVPAGMKLSKNRVIAAHALLEEYAGRMTSRALCLEIESLVDEAEVWWDAWRLPPYERRALYRMIMPAETEETHDLKSRLWIRHCPEHSVTVKNPEDWEPIKSIRSAFENATDDAANRAKKIATEGVAKQTDRRRILRACGARGSGKGSLSRLLMNRKVRQYVFGLTEQNKNEEHTGAFIAHLAFSVEFSSVARALTRFVARQAVEVQMKTDPDNPSIKEGLARTEKDLRNKHPYGLDSGHNTGREILDRTAQDSGYIGDNPRLKRARLLTELTSASRESLSEAPDRFKRGDLLSDEEFRELALAVYVARREDEPRLLLHPELPHAKELRKEDERPHRLDTLRETLAHYTNVAPDGHRLFVCLSGLDRICDRNGDAHNPMHRALFRLLTGAPDLKDDDPNPPIDLLLIAGRPDTPICFLSEELPKDVEPTTEDEKHYSRKSKTKRILKRWPEIKRFGWKERVALQPGGTLPGTGLVDHELLASAQNSFLKWAEESDSAALGHRISEPFSTRQIHRALWDSLALTQLVLTCWCDTVSNRDQEFADFAMKLDQAVARDGSPGVVSAVLGHYRKHSHLGRDTDEAVKGAWNWELDTLVLRHLSLFTLPIEPWVLIGCPMVSERLLKSHIEKRQVRPQGQREEAKEEWCRNSEALEKLQQSLNRLKRRGLVMEVRSAQNTEPLEERSDDEFLHRRFALHRLIRDYFAHQMEFGAANDSDQNHHQISIYCDQPRDLPTPSALHFKLIRDLLDNQIEQTRRTLSVAYRFSHASTIYKRKIWDPDPEDMEDSGSVYTDAAVRIYQPEEGAIAGGLGHMQAISQRLRGTFSLIRGNFSVGALSRLDGVTPDQGSAKPFELYRGWLRGLLNAAAGLERNRKELQWLLTGEIFPENIEDFLKKSPVQEVTELMEKEDAEKKSKATIDWAENNPHLCASYLRLFNLHVPNKRESRLKQFEMAKRMHRVVLEAKAIGFMKLQKTSRNRLRHPYYRDEIAWLYNERGLASLIQGRIFDAIPLFRQALSIMSHSRKPQLDTKAYHSAERRIQLNVAIAQIERGNVAQARAILSDLETSSVSVSRSTPSRVHAYAKGYLALCDHLGGSFERARKDYKEVLDDLVTTRALRGVALFNRHLGSLLQEERNYEQARLHFELSINAAAQAEQRDVQNLAFCARAKLHILEDEPAKAKALVEQVKQYAESMGLYRIMAEALLVDAQLKEAAGEYVVAAESAAHSIAITTRHGMRLLKISGLVLYGRIQAQRNLISLASTMLTEAKSEAENHGYQIAAARAASVIGELHHQSGLRHFALGKGNRVS
ncbi:MAG: SIR2 family protein [Pseudomonadota bacterium]